jgi:hypothetical protein
MPMYSFIDHNTGKTWEELLKISEMEDLLKNNPNIEIYVANANYGPKIISGRPLKPDDGFKDVLKEIKKKTAGKFDTY